MSAGQRLDDSLNPALMIDRMIKSVSDHVKASEFMKLERSFRTDNSLECGNNNDESGHAPYRKEGKRHISIPQ